MFSPVKMRELQIDSTTVDELASFPLLNKPQAELHKYVTAVEDLDPNVNILEWWKRHEQDLPYWASALKDVSQVQQPLNEYFLCYKTLSTINNIVHWRII